jgi:hypothetical protein
MGSTKPFAFRARLTPGEGQVKTMREWTFSATAEWVVGVLLASAIVAALFV